MCLCVILATMVSAGRSGLQGRDAAQLGECLPTFRTNIVT
jgi:hypothetical protein